MMTKRRLREAEEVWRSDRSRRRQCNRQPWFALVITCAGKRWVNTPFDSARWNDSQATAQSASGRRRFLLRPRPVFCLLNSANAT